VRGLREVCRLRWTRRLLTESKQGRVAAGLALDTSTDVAFLTSVRTDLTFQDWHYIHRARLDLLPVRAIPGSKMLDKKCRLGCDKDETSQHVVACCRHNMALKTKRHNEIVAIVALELHKRGYRTIENLAIGNDGLRPDIVIEHNSERLIIDVTVPYDEVENLKRAHAEGKQIQSLRSRLPIRCRMPWILVTVQQRHSHKTEHRSSQLELAATEGQASRDPRNDQHHHQPSRLSQCNKLPEQCKQ